MTAGELCPCGRSLSDGEGWDGLCGECADRREQGLESANAGPLSLPDSSRRHLQTAVRSAVYSIAVTGSASDAALIAEIESYVLRVLVPDALRDWWDLPLPRLHNATARQMLAAGDADRLLAYVRSYGDESFS